MGKNNEEKQVTENKAAQEDTQESTYAGPVKDCTACEATGLNLEDRSKLCEVCNGAGLVPDES